VYSKVRSTILCAHCLVNFVETAHVQACSLDKRAAVQEADLGFVVFRRDKWWG
jgi:hypothetical protein